MPERTSYEPGTPCWVDLGTPDIEASKAFYTGLFGWYAHTSPDPAAGGYTLMTFGADDARAIAALMPQTVQGQPVAWTTYVSVADLDATVAAVNAAGGQVLMEPMDVLDQGRIAIFADAVGAVLGAWQPRAFAGAGVVNDPGAYVWSELACRDIEAAKKFYAPVFGWEGSTSPYEGGSSYTEWSNPGRPPIAGMIQMNEQWPQEIPAHWMVYFAVDDCDVSCAKVAELGGVVSVPPFDIETGRIAVVDDPEGAVFSIIALTG
jgi:uncharacterized protein